MPYEGPGGGQWNGGYGRAGWGPHPPPRNGLGLAALITGLVGLAAGLTVVLSPLGFVLGAVAVAVGVAALRRVRAGTATKAGQARAGVWTGAGAVVVSAVLTVVLVHIVVGIFQFTEVTSTAGTVGSPATAGETVVYADGLTVVAAPDTAGGTVEGKPGHERMLITFTLTNDGDEAAGLHDDDIDVYVDDSEVPSRDVKRSWTGSRTLEPGAKTTVRVTVEAPGDAEILGIDYAPGLDYDFAFWEFDLSGPDGPGGPGGSGRSEDTTTVPV
ncbi:MAG TPA: hypothetical protein VFY14_10540 [Streptomyces sp.]|nr:hypothetical protein [Streptomyces sp.]